MAVHALECEYRTHVGLRRKVNQDFVDCDTRLGAFALADGLGGHRAGEVASRTAVEAAMRELLELQSLEDADELQSLLNVGSAVEAANAAIRDAARAQPGRKGMGTTLVLATFRANRIFHAHVGDSRLYRFREGQLLCLTRDHSLMQEALDRGEYAGRSEALAAGVRDNVLTRSLGLKVEVEAELGDSALSPADLYLACSDGLCGLVEDEEIGDILRAGSTLSDMADTLLASALAAGGRDNISLVLARPVFRDT